MQAPSYHTPVLAEEVLSFLINARRGVYVDGTLGGGGHAEAILKQLEADGSLLGIDADEDALLYASKRLEKFGDRLILHRGNFRDLKKIVTEEGLEGVEGVLLDLGVSSFQLDEPGKGFSFRSDSPLDMRMDRTQSLSARGVVNEYDEFRIADILWKYGEERASRKIAHAIARTRLRKPIESAKDLSRVVEGLIGDRFLAKTLARVYQAIRIEVNNELENLKSGLSDAIDILCSGGRLAVISYHSLEDRIVKETLRAASATSRAGISKFFPPVAVQPRLKILTKKYVGPRESEVRSNPRARSAKLRAAEKL